MKITFLIAISLFLFSSCQEKKLAESNPESKDLEERQNSNKTELENLSENLKGVWLPEDYVQKLKQTKSAFLASSAIPDIAELQIDTKNIRNDSLYITSSLNNHEGYGFKIWITNENGQKVLKTDVRDWEKEKSVSEFKYQIGPDTTITILKKDKKGKTLSTINFKRIRDSKYINEAGGQGFDFLARKNILNGEYHLSGAKGNAIGNVKFNPETEKIIGFKYKFYDLQTDFGTGPEYKGDVVYFLHTPDEYSNSESFAIKVKNDTLQLWTTEEDSTDYSKLKLKDLQYLLIKKKN